MRSDVVLARLFARRWTSLRLMATRWEARALAALARLGASHVAPESSASISAAWTPPAQSRAMRALAFEQRIDAVMERIERLIRDGWIALRLSGVRWAREADVARRRAVHTLAHHAAGPKARLAMLQTTVLFWASAAGAVIGAAVMDVSHAAGLGVATTARPVRASATKTQPVLLDWRMLAAADVPGARRLAKTPVQIALTVAIHAAALGAIVAGAWALAAIQGEPAGLAAALLMLGLAVIAEAALRVARAVRVSSACERFERETMLAFVMRRDAPTTTQRMDMHQALSALTREYVSGARRATWDAPWTAVFVIALGLVGGAAMAGFVAAIAVAFALYTTRAQSRGAPRAQLAHAIKAFETAVQRFPATPSADQVHVLERLGAIVRNAEWAIVYEAERRRGEALLAMIVAPAFAFAFGVIAPMGGVVDPAVVALSVVLAARIMAPIAMASLQWRQRDEICGLHHDVRRLHRIQPKHSATQETISGLRYGAAA